MRLTFFFLVACSMLISCTITDEQRFNKLSRALEMLSNEQLEVMASKGHLSALYSSNLRFCSNHPIEDCLESKRQISVNGYPAAMDSISVYLMPREDHSKPYHNAFESYIWLKVSEHFVLNLRQHPVSVNTELKGNASQTQTLESILTPEQLAEAEIEIERRTQEVWNNLQNYCKDWADKDYVCFYELGEPPSYEDIDWDTKPQPAASDGAGRFWSDVFSVLLGR